MFATSPEDINALLLGGVPPSLHGAIHFTGNGRYFQLWRQALPHIAFHVVHVSYSRNVLLREMGLGPSRISRMGRRPSGRADLGQCRECIRAFLHVIGRF
jgi:hypothetical protein